MSQIARNKLLLGIISWQVPCASNVTKFYDIITSIKSLLLLFMPVRITFISNLTLHEPSSHLYSSVGGLEAEHVTQNCQNHAGRPSRVRPPLPRLPSITRNQLFYSSEMWNIATNPCSKSNFIKIMFVWTILTANVNWCIYWSLSRIVTFAL